MKISVVIPTLNEERYLPRLLDDLSNQNYKADEIIVVDAGSNDKTSVAAKSYKVNFIQARPPVGAQRNLGISKATGDLVCLLDADVRLSKDFFERVIQEYNKNRFDIACPYYLPYPGGIIISPIYYFFNLMFCLFQKITPSGAGSCIFFMKVIWQKSGQLNSKLTYDDIEFIRRASGFGKFRMLPLVAKVSDRRFRKYGVMSSLFKYLLLSVFFTLGLFKLSNLITYKFGNYEQK